MLFSVNDIRAEFIKYFVENGHTHVKSSSLVPDNDPTLMFTNAGMVQFKDTFTGKKVLPYRRATTAQKCLRAGGKHNDLENVGYTARHHTFFEMLGNFSFGDYFKAEVIEFAWNLVTKRLGKQKEKLLVTVHSSDEEAAGIWEKVSGLEDARIIRIPTSDNFWSMGDTGPCGPCSEIFYDHGEEIPGGMPGSENEDGDRFIEIWNLVFMQFETLQDGSRINLPKPSIDTGMGLERIAAVLQGVHSNYDIDLFKTLISDVKNITSTDDVKYTSHYNVIADHIRAISFMISDGIIPTNEGRGYVLRRIIRRALRHGYMMGMKEPFLHKLVSSVKNVMSDHYTEIATNEKTIQQVVKNEEDGFMKTIDKGMFILRQELEKLGTATVFPADVAYKLYDTYGFPFDLTQDILRNEGKRVNETEFDKIASEQKKISKKAWAGTGDSFTDKVWFDVAEKVGKVQFIYGCVERKSRILALVKNSEMVGELKTGDEGYIISEVTPFYAESGGQIGDIGTIHSGNNIAEVVDTKKIAGVVVHKCKLTSGMLKIKDEITLQIDVARRIKTARNHTATHVLQAVLRKVLGSHVVQKGSLNTDEKLRFDFLHNEPITKEQINEIERQVRDVIDKSMPVKIYETDYENAVKGGALALFGEKYPDKVRVVEIGNGFSVELCGGAHLENTSQIGCFKIVTISSVGSGIKRIEALTGRVLAEYYEEQLREQAERIEMLQSDIKTLERQVSELKARNFSDELKFETENVGDIEIRHTFVGDIEQKMILGLIDKAKTSTEKFYMIIGNQNSNTGKISICVYASEKAIEAGIDAKALMEQVKLGVKFGGRPDFVQFGGIDKDMFNKLVSEIKQCLKN